jgi:hypothetical protein
MKLKRILIVFSILALALLACNLGARGLSPTEGPADGPSSGDPDPGGDTSSGEPGDPGSSGDSNGNGESPGQAGGSGEPSATIDLDDLALYAQPDLFNSYRTSMDYLFEAAGPVTGTVLLDSATQVEPYATTLEFFTYGSALTGGETVYTFTQILETQYIVAPGIGCQSGIPGVQANPFEVMLDTGGMLIGEAQYTGEGSANGIDTHIYTLTQDNIDALDPAGQDVREISNGEMHVARDGGYVVRVLLEGRGVNPLLSQDPALEGDVYYELNFYDFDAPVTIEPPPACAGSGDPASDIPLLEDATNIVQMGDDVLTYTTGEGIGDVIEFYEGAMPALACGVPTITGGESEGTAQLFFSDCEGGDVTVLIFAESSDVTQVSVLRTP